MQIMGFHTDEMDVSIHQIGKRYIVTSNLKMKGADYRPGEGDTKLNTFKKYKSKSGDYKYYPFFNEAYRVYKTLEEASEAWNIILEGN